MKTNVKLFQVLRGIIYFFGMPALLLVLGGDIKWWQAWAYIIVSYIAVIISRVLLVKKHPDLIEERAGFNKKKDAKSWDKFLAPLMAMWVPLFYFVTAGLDKRLGWSPPFSTWITVASLLVSLAGFALSTWAIVENRFFSAVVRIQTERGHQVVNSGPYQLLRHPGYAGSLIVAWMFPVITNSIWAFIPVTLYTILVFIRTNLEDKTLFNELEGYKEYSEKIRYRLVPGIW